MLFFWGGHNRGKRGWRISWVCSFHTVLNDRTCSEVLFSGLKSKGSMAVEFVGNYGFLLSIVDAFSLKAKHSHRTHCHWPISNWNEVRGGGEHLHSPSKDFQYCKNLWRVDVNDVFAFITKLLGELYIGVTHVFICSFLYCTAHSNTWSVIYA